METTGLLPPGFLGSRGDILMDVVVLSFALILPALIYSWRQARGKNYSVHKGWQISIFSLLVVAVSLFEADMVLSGGIFVLTADSAYSGSLFFNTLIYTHMLFAIVSALLWIALITVSLRSFDNPPKPNKFSKTHRFWGRIAMVTMMLSGATSLPVYYVGFVL